MATYPQTLKFAAQNWTGKDVEVTLTSETEFEIYGYKFRIGETTFKGDPDERYYIESVGVYSLEFDAKEPSFYAIRFPNDKHPMYSISECDLERSAATVIETVALIAAMCY